MPKSRADGVLVGGNNGGLINLDVLIQQGTRPGASGEELCRAYLNRLLQQANQLPLFSGDSARAEVRLSSIYTALLTQGGEYPPTPKVSFLEDGIQYKINPALRFARVIAT